jgi:hypothetical protein
VAGWLTAVNHAKTDVLSSIVRSNWPHTAIVGIRHQLGETALTLEAGLEEQLLETLLDDVDLLIDATAEIALQQYLGDLAQDRGIPQLYFWATPGAAGGLVARVVPGRTGCWFCLQLHLERGSIPTPPHRSDASVQPRGCGSPTFTGASFDLLPVVAQGARVATSMLSDGSLSGDVYVLSLIDDGHDLPAPSWSTHQLARDPECPICGAG